MAVDARTVSNFLYWRFKDAMLIKGLLKQFCHEVLVRGFWPVRRQHFWHHLLPPTLTLPGYLTPMLHAAATFCVCNET